MSFVSDYYCRFCRASKYDAHKLYTENSDLMRNINNYEEDVKSLKNGIKKMSIFNQLPCSHVTLNSTCNLMHDFYLGVCRYDMARIIDSFIKKKYFSLDRLNNRLKYFDHMELDRGNKISPMKAKHLRDGYIIITSAQMSALVTYFGIIIGDLIPHDDIV